MKKERSVITMDGQGNIALPTDTTNIWMSEFELVELFGVIAPTVRAGIKAVYKSGVLKEYETKRHLHLANGCGLDVYSLDMVVALAFRINTFGAAKVRNMLLEKILYRRKEKTYLFTIPFGSGWCC
jgi:lipofamily protein